MLGPQGEWRQSWIQALSQPVAAELCGGVREGCTEAVGLLHVDQRWSICCRLQGEEGVRTGSLPGEDFFPSFRPEVLWGSLLSGSGMEVEGVGKGRETSAFDGWLGSLPFVAG